MHLRSGEERPGGVRGIARLGRERDVARIETGEGDMRHSLLAAEHRHDLRRCVDVDSEAIAVERGNCGPNRSDLGSSGLTIVGPLRRLAVRG